MRPSDFPYRFNDVSVNRVITSAAAYVKARKMLISKVSGYSATLGPHVDGAFAQHRPIGRRLVCSGLYIYLVGPRLCGYVKQLDVFSKAVDRLADNEFCCLDIEDETLDPVESFRVASSILEDRFGGKCMVYLPDKFAGTLTRKITGDRLVWAPRYGSTEPNWAHDIWQYTDNGDIPGCIQNGDDSVTLHSAADILNRTRGDGDLLAWCASNPDRVRSILREAIG